MAAEHHQSLNISMLSLCPLFAVQVGLPDQVEACLPWLGLELQHSQEPSEPVTTTLTVSVGATSTAAKATKWQAAAVCCGLHTEAS